MPPVPSLVEWLQSFGLDAAAALDPMAELTGDGHSNFIKYALGLDPTVAHGTSAAGENEGALPSLVRDESGLIRLSHLRRRNAPLSYEVQVSSTFRTWEPVMAAVQSVEVLSPQWERVTYEMDQAALPEAPTLLRVKIRSLWNLMDVDVQDAITTTLCSMMPMARNQFLPCLDEAAETFREFRYMHEHGVLKTNPKLLQLLAVEIRKLDP